MKDPMNDSGQLFKSIEYVMNEWMAIEWQFDVMNIEYREGNRLVLMR